MEPHGEQLPQPIPEEFFESPEFLYPELPPPKPEIPQELTPAEVVLPEPPDMPDLARQEEIRNLIRNESAQIADSPKGNDEEIPAPNKLADIGALMSTAEEVMNESTEPPEKRKSFLSKIAEFFRKMFGRK